MNAAGLIQHIYFEDTLTSKFKSKYMLLLEKDFALVSIGKESIQIRMGYDVEGLWKQWDN